MSIKKNKMTLLESELRYRRLFEAAQDGILILDFDTGQMSFFSQVLQGQVTPTHLPSYWRIAPRINQE